MRVALTFTKILLLSVCHMQALMNNPDCKNQDKNINDGKSMFDDRKLGLMVVKWKKTFYVN